MSLVCPQCGLLWSEFTDVSCCDCGYEIDNMTRTVFSISRDRNMTQTTGIICWSGVLQLPGFSDGIRDLAEQLGALPNVDVLLRRNYQKKIHVAASWLLHQNAFDRIALVGHSHGVFRCADVAEEVEKAGRSIDAMFSADGWDGDGELVIPGNVLYLESWIQSTERPDLERHPHGSEIVVKPSTLHVAHEGPRDVGHNGMDALEDFWNAVIKFAKGQ